MTLKRALKWIFSFEAAILGSVITLIAGVAVAMDTIKDHDKKIEKLENIAADVQYIRGVVDEIRRTK